MNTYRITPYFYGYNSYASSYLVKAVTSEEAVEALEKYLGQKINMFAILGFP